MTLHYTKYKENYKKFILSTIDSDINEKPIKKDIDKINYIFKRFYSEYGFFIPKIGKQKALAEWLSGLALDIPYYNDDIIDLAVEMGSTEPNPSDDLRYEITKNYFNFMANIILDMEKK
tara:strand:+ start:148 stop:504 length:357 start_codon:yes stop_codon:yes gene_type:complete